MRRLSMISISTVIIVTTVAVGAHAAARQSTPPAPPALTTSSPFDQGQAPPTPPAAAQTPKPGATPTQAPQAPQGQQPQTPPKPPDPAQMVNVRVELTITEAHGSNAPVKKTVLLITRSDSRGSIRSIVFRPDNQTMSLNVDARPHVEKDGRIDLNLTFNYSPEPTTDAPASGVNRPGDLNESMDIFLVDGKPLLISQSADAKGDRRVTVEVTATVVK